MRALVVALFFGRCFWFWVVLAGCSSSVDVPSVQESGIVDRGPCDVFLYVEECRAAGLPSDYGVAWGCHQVTYPRGYPRPRFRSCIDAGDFKCCEALQ